MKHFSRLAVIVAAVAAATLPSPSAAEEPPGTITVTRLTATKQHVAAMETCTRGDDSWERYAACQKVHNYERYGRCLQRELHYADGTMHVVHRDPC